jgi:hypothetical protein
MEVESRRSKDTEREWPGRNRVEEDEEGLSWGKKKG